MVDAQYPHAISTIGPANGFLSGMWLNRTAAANDAAVLIHGSPRRSRYVAYATNPFSRYDAEREWPLIVQSALWSDLTDEGQIAFTITAADAVNGTLSPSGAKTVAVGNDETYTIKPDTGYHLVDVLVDGASVGAVTSYKFDNVAEDHTSRRASPSTRYDIRPRPVPTAASRRPAPCPSTTARIRPSRSRRPGLQDPRRARRRQLGRRGDQLHVQRSLGTHTISASFAVNPVPWKVTFSLSSYW